MSGNICNVIYIMGDGRSGSTVHGILLGNHEQIVDTGETNRWVTYRGNLKPGDYNREKAGFWRKVKDYYAPLRSDVPWFKIEEAQAQIEAYQNVLSVLTGTIEPDTASIYQNHNERLFKAIGLACGKKWVLDSSKSPGRALQLWRCPNLNVKVIHLVRDPRGVLNSQLKRNVEHIYKPTSKALSHYWIKNLMCLLAALLVLKNDCLIVRYEDLVQDPANTLQKLGRFLDLDMSTLINKINRDESLKIQYPLDGNRIRKKDFIRLRLDKQWKIMLSPKNKFIATATTWPLYSFITAMAYIRSKDYF